MNQQDQPAWLRGAVLTRYNLTSHGVTTAQAEHIERIRAAAKALGDAIHEHCPHGREQSLALTNLEQCSMWAIAGVARQHDPR